jgi:hypothetical protein
MALLDIEQTLSQYHIPYRRSGEHHHVTRDFLGVDCPQCSPNSMHFRLGIHKKGYATCWRCGYASLYKVLVALGVPEHAAYKLVDNRLDGDSGQSTHPQGTLKAPSHGPLQACHEAYLRRRGFDPVEITKVWGIGGIGLHATHSWRIYIPIHLDGREVSWTTRATGDQAKKKYLMAKPSEEIVAGRDLLYGIDHVQHTVVICEGPLDVWKIGPGAVATFGIAYSVAQWTQLTRYARRIICFDADAQKKADVLGEQLCLFPGDTHNIELDHGDPGEADPDTVGRIRSLMHA